MSSISRASALTLSFLLLMPLTSQARDIIQLGFTDKKLDAFFDSNLNFHQVPKTNVMLSAKVKSVNAQEIDQALTLDVNSISREVLVKAFDGQETKDGFTISGKSEGDSLFITPWVLLQFLDDGQVTAWTCWNVEYWDLYWNKKKWEGYCFAGLSGARPLEGKDGWTAQEGLHLKEAIQADTRELLECAMKDLSGSYKNVKFEHSKFQGVWIAEKKPKEISASFFKTAAGNLLINKYDDRAYLHFRAGGLTGLFLKAILPNSVLFNGSLLMPSEAVQVLPDKPTSQPTATAVK
ncbi:MAG TPA: hypothetical protein VMV05_06470 [bacterium]|nr:hypothetical protein [bacterium]